MEITKTWTAIREDRALTPAHGGAALCGITSSLGTVAPMGAFVPSAYVVDQESNKPRVESG